MVASSSLSLWSSLQAYTCVSGRYGGMIYETIDTLGILHIDYDRYIGDGYEVSGWLEHNCHRRRLEQ